MNTESKMIKPKNDFQLDVNYSDHCVWKALRNDILGAGADADAASGVVDMTLSTTEPLSEIVWSPNTGFSLNCVDSSFLGKNASLYKDVRPSRMILALLQSVTGGDSNSDMPMDDSSVNPITIIRSNSGISSTDTPSRHPSDQSGVDIPDHKAHKEHDTGPGGTVEKIDAGRGDPDFHSDQKENLMNYCEKNICGPANIGTVIKSDTKGNKSSATSGQVERPVDNFILQADELKPNVEQNPEPTELFNGGMDICSGNKVLVTEDDLCTKVEHKIEYEDSVALTSSSRSPVKKLESTAENDIQTFNCEATYAATSIALVSISNEDQNKSKGNGMMQPCDKNLLFSHSPCSSRIHKAMNKSKERSLFDGNANASLLKERNDEHLSIESCYSAGLFLTGKKRCNFQQQLIIGSKRIKKRIQDTSCSTSKVKGDSSFMNLISNMMKGLSSSQSTQDEDNPDHHFLWPDQKLITCNENQDPESKNSYFKSNLKCISWPSMKNLETMKSHQVGESSKDFELGNKVHGINVTPINFYAENNSFYNQYLQSDEFEASTRVCDAGPSLRPKIRPIHFLHSNQNRKNNSLEKEGLTLHSRQDKINNEHPHKHLSCLNSFKIEGTREQPADEHFISEAKKPQDCFINKEASIGFKDHKGNNDHTSKHKFNSISPFPGFGDSETMASMFARRLGAMKHILTDTADSIPHK